MQNLDNFNYDTDLEIKKQTLLNEQAKNRVLLAEERTYNMVSALIEWYIKKENFLK